MSDKVEIDIVNVGGMGLMSVLFLVFLVLKLTAVIDWSWWWVTVPLWGPATAIVSFVVLFFGVGLLYLWIKEKWL